MCAAQHVCVKIRTTLENILWGSMFIKVKRLPLQSHLTLQQAYPIFFLFVAFPSIQQESGNETLMGVHSILILPAIQKHSASCLPEHSGTRFCSSMELAGTNKIYTTQNKYSTEEWKRQYLHLPLHPLHIQY